MRSRYPTLRELDESPLSGFHVKTVITAGMGFFTDAYDLFIIGVVSTILRPLWHLDALAISLLSSTALLSAALGAVIFGRIADRLGRKFVYGYELLVLAAGAWALLLWQAAHSMGGMGLTMGLNAPLFVALWIVMMVATMFPAAAPMVLMFARVHAGKRQHGQPFVPTWVFVGAYLLVWTLFGVVAYGLAVGLDTLADRSRWLLDHGARLGGVQFSRFQFVHAAKNASGRGPATTQDSRRCLAR